MPAQVLLRHTNSAIRTWAIQPRRRREQCSVLILRQDAVTSPGEKHARGGRSEVGGRGRFRVEERIEATQVTGE
jgi:hypothetical protein